MAVFDLKQDNLEQSLVKMPISQEEKNKIRSEIHHFDEYYLTDEGKTVKVFRQEFVKDPHMDLQPIAELRLVLYDYNVDSDDLENIFNKDDVPIITRIRKEVHLLNFRYIKSKAEGPSILIPTRLTINKILGNGDTTKVRSMKEEDIPKIKEMFRNQYSLRYKMAELMFLDCPEACFVFEDDEILGATFNKIDNEELYMRQIFVKEQHRAIGIGKALYQKRLEFAKNSNITTIRGNVRKEAWRFHFRYNAKILEGIEYYVIRVN